jgi:hypothetical protein
VDEDALVFVQGLGRGEPFRLTGRSISAGKLVSRTLLEGGWEVGRTQIDATRHLVVMPVQEDGKPFRIRFVDSKWNVVADVPVGRYPEMLAASANGTVAYSAHPCRPGADQENLADGKASASPRTLCILRRE